MKNRNYLTLATIAACMLLNASHLMAETKDIPVPKAMLATTINAALSATQINIDTYGSKNGTSWYHDNSYVLTPDGQKQKMSLPEITYLLKSTVTGNTMRTWKAYVNDFATTSLSVVPDNDQFKLNAVFESAGEEIKTKCINRQNKECTLNVERDGEINNAVLSVKLKPVVLDNSIGYATNPAVSFSADIKMNNKLCNIGGDICNRITKYKSNIKTAVEKNLQTGLNGYRKAVAAAVKTQLAKVLPKNWTLKAIKSSGGNFILTVEYPDPVDSNTMTIKSFSVMNKNLTVQCPAKVSFKAEVHSKYKLAGQAWLENENGSTTKKLDFAIGKNAAAESVIERAWEKSDFVKHSGWSKLVITYKDQDGKTITKKSLKANFFRTCSKGPTGMKM